jgi:branched-chain amino acid transport system ATP-binding protein
MPELLTVEQLSVRYGGARAVDRIDLTVPHRGAVALLGANGAGKSSVLKAIAGLVEASGTVTFDGRDISHLPSRKRIELGIVYVPEGRELVLNLTVDENLTLGGFSFNAAIRKRRRDTMLALFPEIATRLRSPAWTLSGGEQQMLAIARGLMSGPRLLLLDEPSLGLAPLLTKRVFERLGEIRTSADFSVLLVEQNFNMALSLVDAICFMRSSHIVGRRDANELRNIAGRRGDTIDIFLGADDSAASTAV